MSKARTRTLLGTVGTISLATGLSRILGLVRDQAMAYFFGAGFTTDAFIAAFRVPNLLRDLFAEGALSSAFVPTFTRVREIHGREAAWRLANRLIGALMIVLGTLAVVIFLFAPWILRAFALGFSDAKIDLAVSMTRILAPFPLFIALAAVAMGMLNSCGRFFLPALAPASFNVCAILGMVILYPVFRSVGIDTGLSLAVGAAVGGAMQYLIQTAPLGREGYRFRPELAPRDPGLRRIAGLMIPATIGLAATQVNILVDTQLASLQGDGPVSWLQYAFRLMQLPIGLFGVAIATANLARVSRDAAREDMEGLRSHLAGALRAAALLTLPATAGLIALREPIVRVLFQRGEFTAADTGQTAAAVLCYALGLYAYAVTKIQAPTFYALGDSRKPAIFSAVAVALKIAASLVLINTLGGIGVEPFLGLALSTSLAAWLNFGLLWVGLNGKIGRLAGLGIVPTTMKVLALSAVMGTACRGFHRLLESSVGGGGLAWDLTRLLSAVAAGIVITGCGALLLRVPEALAMLHRLGKGGKRS